MIDNKKISKFAISVITELQKNNFQAYLVGGCVRDALSGIEPKDFDIATDATPEEVRKAFKLVLERIKPTDAVIVGMYPCYTDQVRENADIVRTHG